MKPAKKSDLQKNIVNDIFQYSQMTELRTLIFGEDCSFFCHIGFRLFEHDSTPSERNII